jgi:3-oxoacyl-[acyl-carrier protein] reductase
MDLGLAGRTALVLGARRGLGRASAAALLAEGAIVHAASRNVAAIQAWRATLPAAEAGRLHPGAVDLADLGSVDVLLDALGSAPDRVVLNGGGPPQSMAAEIDLALWAAQFRAMATHQFHVANGLLPGMRARGWGRILVIASSGVEQPIPNLAISNSIRAAVSGWAKTLADEVAADGVTVNLLLPGRIHTDRVDALDSAAAERAKQTPAEVAAASQRSIPAGRYGTPDEFASVLAFLASARASYVTGTQIRVDGGLIRSIG